MRLLVHTSFSRVLIGIVEVVLVVKPDSRKPHLSILRIWPGTSLNALALVLTKCLQQQNSPQRS